MNLKAPISISKEGRNATLCQKDDSNILLSKANSWPIDRIACLFPNAGTNSGHIRCRPYVPIRINHAEPVSKTICANQHAGRNSKLHGLFFARAYPVRYGANDRRIVGAPDWFSSEKYDINAKVPAGNVFTFEQIRHCVEAMLAAQFNLEFHREKRVIPLYELVVAAEGLKLQGPQFGGPHQSRIVFTSGHVEASGVNMSAFAQDLGSQTGSVVVDKTGITASYDFTLDWTPSKNQTTSISEALERQLGLQLNPTTGPVELFVIDRVEKAHALPRST
jgi:uncharacterized protein (TIGR03435 family)